MKVRGGKSLSASPGNMESHDKSIPVVGRISLLICTIIGEQFLCLQHILAYRKCTNKDGSIWGTREDNNTPFKVVLGDDAHEESSVRLRLANSIAHRHCGISARGHGRVLAAPTFLEVI
jgi:hypothetical protein